jgi:small subunit ribosomal protein S6
MARDYELGIVINPEVGDDQARAVVERVSQLIINNGGEVVRVNAWGRRRLAYPIERHRDGLYFFFDLILDPQSIVEIERTIRVNEDVVRHLLKLRDPRVVAQQRVAEAQRDADREAEAIAQAERDAQAAINAANAPAEAEAPVAEAPTAEAPTAEEAPEATNATETGDEPAAAPVDEDVANPVG